MIAVRERLDDEPVYARERGGDRVVPGKEQRPQPHAREQRDHDLAEDERENDRRQRRQKTEPTRFDGNVHSAPSRVFPGESRRKIAAKSAAVKRCPALLSPRPETPLTAFARSA